MYTAIEANRRRTLILTASLVLFAGALVEVIGLALGLPAITAAIVAGIATVIALLVALGTYRSGDALVLSVSEAQATEREQYPDLYRTVENLCIGAGLPMPKIYVINDGAPNAFATGRDPKHASIAVTSGLIEKMSNLELEGVIGHELSHIGNHDTRLMLIIAVMVGWVAIVVDVFLRFTWYGAGARRRYQGRGENAGGAVLLLLAVVAAVIAPLVAWVIQMSISRQREYLADASSALLTRYPEGLASALEKIAGDKDPLDVSTKGTAHLWIAEPFKGQKSAFNALFDTHPPIQDRILRLRAMEA
ncbi:MAG: M48 family metallopeptidase [Chloroflexi bacterium]|nr:M48 family metallopeptidase [Chloroflexota bacterium]